MPGMSQATDMLAAYIACEQAILLGQEGRIGDRTYRLPDLQQVQAGRAHWQAKVNAESAAASGAPTIGGLSFAVARFDS